VPNLGVTIRNLFRRGTALQCTPRSLTLARGSLGSTSVASENALKKYRDNIANLNMRRLTQTLHSLTVPLDPRFNAKVRCVTLTLTLTLQ
jgi:hypothetical protein